MKKYFLLMASMLMSVVAYAAKGDVVLRSGDAKVFAVKGSVINVVFDYAGSQIYDMDQEKYFAVEDYVNYKGEEWMRDFPKELAKAETAFVEEFNDESKSVTMSLNSSSAKFTLTFRLKDFSYGKHVVWVSSQRPWGTGVIEVTDNETNQVVASFEFNKLQVASDYGFEKRRKDCYETIAKALAKLLNKASKK